MKCVDWINLAQDRGIWWTWRWNLSRYCAVGIATDYGLYGWGVGIRVMVGARLSCSPQRPYRLWAPPSLLFNGYSGPFPRGWRGRCVKLTTYFHLVPTDRTENTCPLLLFNCYLADRAENTVPLYLFNCCLGIFCLAAGVVYRAIA
jgi:hypothetical protein